MEWLFPGDECANERKKRKCLDAQNWRFQKSLNELTSWTASMLHQQCYTVALQHCFTTALLHCCTTALLLLQHNCAEDDQEEMCKEKEEVSQGQNKNCKSWKKPCFHENSQFFIKESLFSWTNGSVSISQGLKLARDRKNSIKQLYRHLWDPYKSLLTPL